MTSASVKALLLKRDYDVIYAYSTSPVLMSLPASLLRCFTKRKLMIYVLDIWPACLAAMNVREDSFFYGFMKKVSRWVYCRADMLIYSSKRFQEYLRQVHGITVADEQYMPQFADDVFRRALPPCPPKTGAIDLVFAGNIGKVQAVEILIQTAALLRNEPIRWHIIGDGSNEEDWPPACRFPCLGKRHLLWAAAFERYALVLCHGGRYACKHAGRYQRKRYSSRKGTKLHAAGKPVLGSIAGETAYVIRQAQCGFCAPPDDPEAFAGVVRRFLAAGDKLEMGRRGQAYYDAHFTKREHMDRLESMLTALAGGK